LFFRAVALDLTLDFLNRNGGIARPGRKQNPAYEDSRAGQDSPDQSRTENNLKK